MKNQSVLESYFECLSQTYDPFRGRSYHIDRMARGGGFVTLAQLPNGQVVGGCYVKNNGRRGATFLSKNYQNLGLGQKIVTTSLGVYSEQYSLIPIYHSNNIRQLLTRSGFQVITTDDSSTLVNAVKNFEGGQIGEIESRCGILIFSRFSNRRKHFDKSLLSFVSPAFYERREIIV